MITSMVTVRFRVISDTHTSIIINRALHVCFRNRPIGDLVLACNGLTLMRNYQLRVAWFLSIACDPFCFKRVRCPGYMQSHVGVTDTSSYIDEYSSSLYLYYF